MGDMADYYLDGIDCWPTSRRFVRPSIARQVVTCRICGGKNYQWKQFNGAWRLANPDGSPHECGEIPSAREAFKD